jgi:hypothetical protein
LLPDTPHPTKKKHWTPQECIPNLLIGCMKLLFPHIQKRKRLEKGNFLKKNFAHWKGRLGGEK